MPALTERSPLVNNGSRIGINRSRHSALQTYVLIGEAHVENDSRMQLKTLWRQLDANARIEFCRVACTKESYLQQLLGGHRSPSLRLLTLMVAASRQIAPDKKWKWLSFQGLLAELGESQRKRAERKAAAAAQL